MSKLNQEEVTAIAKACHQANKAWCEVNGDNSQKDWEEAEQWQRDSAIMGVNFRLENPTAGQDAQHNAWSKDKLADGWVYGEEKDAEAKTHPCLVPFNELPEFQQKKDALFCAVVDSLIGRTPKDNAPAVKPFDNDSIGAKRVRVTFNPGNNDVVQNLKEHFARSLNRVEKLREKEVGLNNEKELQRLVSLSQTAIEEGAMWAVKAATL